MITTHGQDEKFTQTVSCENCATILKYPKAAVCSVPVGIATKWYIVCPVCKAQVKV